MRYDTSFCITLFLANKDLTEQEFVRRCGAKDGYALEEFKRIYGIFFSEAENISLVYRNYYNMEYQSIYEFLYFKYCIPADMIDEFRKEMDDNINLQLWKVNQLSYGGFDNQFVFSDEFYDRFDNILKMED